MISAHPSPTVFPLYGPSALAFDPCDAGVHKEQSFRQFAATHQWSRSGEEQRLGVPPASCLLNTWIKAHYSTGAARCHRPSDAPSTLRNTLVEPGLRERSV